MLDCRCIISRLRKTFPGRQSRTNIRQKFLQHRNIFRRWIFRHNIRTALSRWSKGSQVLEQHRKPLWPVGPVGHLGGRHKSYNILMSFMSATTVQCTAMSDPIWREHEPDPYQRQAIPGNAHAQASLVDTNKNFVALTKTRGKFPKLPKVWMSEQLEQFGCANQIRRIAV